MDHKIDPEDLRSVVEAMRKANSAGKIRAFESAYAEGRLRRLSMEEAATYALKRVGLGPE